jgi:hypothetical protein
MQCIPSEINLYLTRSKDTIIFVTRYALRVTRYTLRVTFFCRELHELARKKIIHN